MEEVQSCNGLLWADNERAHRQINYRYIKLIRIDNMQRAHSFSGKIYEGNQNRY